MVLLDVEDPRNHMFWVTLDDTLVVVHHRIRRDDFPAIQRLKFSKGITHKSIWRLESSICRALIILGEPLC